MAANAQHLRRVLKAGSSCSIADLESGGTLGDNCNQAGRDLDLVASQCEAEEPLKVKEEGEKRAEEDREDRER